MGNLESHTASVLDFHISETVKLELISIGNKTERIEEAKWRLGAKLILKGLNGRARRLLAGRSEGGGRSDEGSSDDGLHGVVECRLLVDKAVQRR